MCELFAMSSQQPTALTYSLEEFSKNGSSTRNNRDGWGIALKRDRDAFLIKEPQPANDSPWKQFIADNPIETTLAIAHVRNATRGKHTLENTHPFRRSLGNRLHLFAHNGTLHDIENHVDMQALAQLPIGDTDSELAFCELLTRLSPLYQNQESPCIDQRYEIFQSFCKDMKSLGSSNFFYHDGETLFVHGHRRIYEENGSFTAPKPPGLHIKKCWTCSDQKEVSCPGLNISLQGHQTILLASVPLDDEGWEQMEEGEILAIENGAIVRS